MYKILLIIVTVLLQTGCDRSGNKVMDHSRHGKEVSDVVSDKMNDKVEEKKEYYTCAMHPHIKEKKSGKCPICQMTLTKVTVMLKGAVEEGDSIVGGSKEGKNNNTVGKVILSKAELDHFNPMVFVVEKMKMSKKLRVLGQVKSAERKESTISARFPARVEKVFIESIGSQVKKGDPVVKVYSPELLTTGEELILSANHASGESRGFKKLFDKAKEKLLLWGIKLSQINSWVKNGKVPRVVTLFANSSGVVRKRLAVPGKYFKEGQNYFELSDLSQVWVEMDVYEHDSNLVKVGHVVSLNFVASPGKIVSGEINFISPTISVKTRTLKVRTTISNNAGLLKPGMVAQGQIAVSIDGSRLVVPTSAIIDTGIRKIVWVKTSSNKYIAKAVETGFFSDGYSEIVNGVVEGDKVVVEGNFMLDAQAQFFGGYEGEIK